jgi:hypothetical protein
MLQYDDRRSRLLKIIGGIVFIILLIFPVYILFFQQDIPETRTPQIFEYERPDTVAVQPPDQVGLPEITPEIEREPEPEIVERTPPAPAPAPALRGETTMEFPTTQESRSTRRMYTIQNTGNRPLEITALSITGGDVQDFKYTGPGSITIPPRGSQNLEVEFYPMTDGEKNAVLRIQSNDRRRNPFEVRLSGTGISEGSVKQIADDLFDEGSDFFNARRYDVAEEVYNNVLELDPFYASAYLMRGRSRYEQGNYLAAVGDFDNVLKFRLSLPRAERERFECISLYYGALSLTEQSLRSGSQDERERFRIPALGRWEDFMGVCQEDDKLLQNAHYWVDRLRQGQ